MMKVVITGASGFVGTNLNKYLSKMNYVVERLSLRSNQWEGRVEMSDSSAIIHLAGKAHDTSNTSNPDEYFQINRDLTIKLFKEFIRSNIRDFFYFSSVKAVADTVDGILSEDSIRKPLTPYGKSKKEAEDYLLNQKLPEGKRLFIIRPCMIHGPGNKGNLNLLFKIVEKGFPWPLAYYSNERSFLSVDNLSFMVHSMLQDEQVPSAIYNFADDDTMSTNDLIILIANTLSQKEKLWHIPEKIIDVLVKIGDVCSLPLNSERLKKLTESYVVSNKKIKKALRIEKLPLSVKEGLTLTINSFRKH
ncbi:NAD-dependent epimerase/dehydratase family protein [Sphingobacterium multivorum]|uniref:NAD-dependent epimerase/dehydratase family protein n=1 Tax=Sphingobacterium multivorum TaxID=28454 RepID=UPI0028AE0276|nr:NAD-dependent epimerase/dehydratase family protein [Sphingobacterium multivorum]